MGPIVEVEVESAVGPRVLVWGDADCAEVESALPAGWTVDWATPPSPLSSVREGERGYAHPLVRASAAAAVAAIGSDGTRLVVWGLGDDEETALEDAVPYAQAAHPMPRLRCVDVDNEQRARIVAGEIDCVSLGIT